MHDLMIQLGSYARGAWRYRWHAQLIAWPLCIAGWVLVYLLPNQYEAAARIYVDTQSMLRPLLQGLAVQTDVNAQVQSLMRTLLSRPNLEKVARMTDLDLEAKTPEEMELMLNRLNKKVVLTNTGRENIFSISFKHENPEKAKEVVQSLMTLFVESSLGEARNDTSAAQRFLDDQIKEYESKLFAAEERLKEFKRQNVNVMPSEGRGYYERLQSETTVLERAKLDLREAENRRDELQSQLSGEEPSFGMILEQPKGAASPIELRIQALETKLDELLLKYTDSHPDVVTVRSQIDDLRAQEKKRVDAQASKGAKRTQTLETNPVYQQLKIALGDAEASVAGLRVRVREYQERVNQLNRMVDTVPQVEAELARLNRDYSVNKQNYETLISRRESAKISEEAEQSSDNLKFKIVDPPRVGLNPVSPNRPLLSSVVLLGGLAMGFVFALFMSQVKPTFDHHRAVFAATNVPVLGYVSMVWTDGARLRNRVELISYAALTGALIIAYAVYLAMQLLPSAAP